MINHELVGKYYTFEDGNRIEVIQVKQRDDGLWVTYNISQPSSLPRKLLMPLEEFIKNFGHLF